MDSELPKGRRFSQVYLKRGEPTQDSPRMRRRLCGLQYDIDDFSSEFASEIKRELGITVPYNGYYNWDQFFDTCELVDLLDTITIGFRFLIEKRKGGMRDLNAANKWILEASRIFSEENVRYKIDDSGGVHFSIDEEFERSRNSSIAALNRPRYANVQNAFEEAFAQLAHDPPDGKRAIRATFSAAEGLFRLMFPNSPRLTGQEIEKQLAPLLQRQHGGDPAVAGAASKLLNSFKDWVDGAHFYRHEPGQQEIAQPPLPLAINMVSLGASYIRWLAEIDAPNC